MQVATHSDHPFGYVLGSLRQISCPCIAESGTAALAVWKQRQEYLSALLHHRQPHCCLVLGQRRAELGCIMEANSPRGDAAPPSSNHQRPGQQHSLQWRLYAPQCRWQLESIVLNRQSSGSAKRVRLWLCHPQDERCTIPKATVLQSRQACPIPRVFLTMSPSCSRTPESAERSARSGQEERCPVSILLACLSTIERMSERYRGGSAAPPHRYSADQSTRGKRSTRCLERGDEKQIGVTIANITPSGDTFSRAWYCRRAR